VCTHFVVSYVTESVSVGSLQEEHEQGRIQGALYSLSSLASAVGPVSLRVVYHFTKDGAFPGPGTMFIFAALLYLLATCFACALPKEQANSAKRDLNAQTCDDGEESSTPLI